VPCARVGSGSGIATAATARRTGGDRTRGVRGGRATGRRRILPFLIFSPPSTLVVRDDARRKSLHALVRLAP